MIPDVTTRFPTLVRDHRRATMDPTTGEPYTQAGLADAVTRLLGEEVSRSAAAGWENGKIVQPQPKHVNAICRILNIDPVQALEALGFAVTNSTLRPDEMELLSAYRRLQKSPALQETALRVIRALPPQQAAQPRSTRRRRTPEPVHEA